MLCFALSDFVIDLDVLAFAKHTAICEALEVKTFFARPYTSKDKGTVKNRMALIRRFLPKRKDFRMVTNQLDEQIEKLINIRTVRKFNYKSPRHEFSIKLHLSVEPIKKNQTINLLLYDNKFPSCNRISIH